jgi:hypothetical protein
VAPDADTGTGRVAHRRSTTSGSFSVEALVRNRSSLGRFLLGLGLVCGGLVALAGTLCLGGAGLVAVLIAGIVSAALAAGLAREAPGVGRGAVREAALRAGGGTVGLLLLVTGISVVAGGVVAALATGVAAVGALTWWLLRRAAGRRASGGGRATPPPTTRQEWAPTVLRPVTTALPWTAPVSALTTPELGREWLRTTTVLARRLEPGARQVIVDRRRQALDELEQRDPVGFARWMAAGPAPGSDPADFVRGAMRGDHAAGTDAA